ncbi:cAMP-specific 3',5'-cyclic phosphodiesterase 4D [Nowakowskiella sp. JEL0407]|nr:cAMP-specific 3',5'-cyclic phosphodiesterase 4D [Nowakowskiella sp. JEL0407]
MNIQPIWSLLQYCSNETALVENQNFSFVVMVCCSLATVWATYRVESADRKDFITNFGLLKSNNKLRHQLSGLQKEYEINAADFDSPLEKSILILKSVMADPLILPHMYKDLESVVNFLQTNDLLTPDFNQNPGERLSVDILSQAWLETFLPQRQSKIRNSKNAPGIGKRKETIGSLEIVESNSTSITSLPSTSNDDPQSLLQIDSQSSKTDLPRESPNTWDTEFSTPKPTKKQNSSKHQIDEVQHTMLPNVVEVPPDEQIEVNKNTRRRKSENTSNETNFLKYPSIMTNLDDPDDPSSSEPKKSRTSTDRPWSPWSITDPEPDQTQKLKNEQWIQKKRVNILLDSVGNWNWNIFEMEKLSPGRPLFTLAKHLFKKRDLVKSLNLVPRKLARFISVIEDGYHPDVPYHNSTHATDVLHAVNYFCNAEPFCQYITDFEILVAYISAIIHDHDHPGLNNAFLTKKSDIKALLYNDKSVLENHHLASSFQILLRDECNFMENMSTEEYRSFREQVIEMVIATDISMHFQTLSSFKNKVVVSKNFDFNIPDDRALLWKTIIKAADVNNVTKTWDLYRQWLDRLTEEFFRQGDKERELGMQITPFMDRNEMAIPHSQISFMDFISMPLFEVLSKILKPAEAVVCGLLANREAMVAWRDFQVYPGTEFDTGVNSSVGYSVSNKQLNSSVDDGMSLSGTMPFRGGGGQPNGIFNVAQRAKVNFALGSSDGIFRAKGKVAPEGDSQANTSNLMTPMMLGRRSSAVMMDAIHSTLEKFRGTANEQ